MGGEGREQAEGRGEESGVLEAEAAERPQGVTPSSLTPSGEGVISRETGCGKPCHYRERAEFPAPLSGSARAKRGSELPKAQEL